MAETKTYKTKEDKAVDIARLIVANLEKRRGFDEVFPKISTKVMTLLLLDIATIVKEGI